MGFFCVGIMMVKKKNQGFASKMDSSVPSKSVDRLVTSSGPG